MDTTPGPDPGDPDPPAAAGVASSSCADDEVPGIDLAPGSGDATSPDPGPHDPLGFQGWMKRSATGAVLSGIALGLQQALEPKRELPAFVMEAPGEPDDPDAPIVWHFDPDDPTKTVAVVRPPVPGGPPMPPADADPSTDA